MDALKPLESLDFGGFYFYYNSRFWVLARTADPSVPDLLTWLDSFDSFPIFVVFVDLQELIISAFKTAKEVKNTSKKKTTTAKLG